MVDGMCQETPTEELDADVGILVYHGVVVTRQIFVTSLFRGEENEP